MIHWLAQSADSYPTGPDGVVLDGVLHPREQARFATLKTEKRRQDWLLGRLTAKQLIREVQREKMGEGVPLTALEVGNGERGEPIVNCELSIVNCQGTASNLQSLISLSISHSHGHAFCALVERPDWPLGADIERIEARSEAFVADYFTEEERGLETEAVGEMRDVWVTAVWSAKESVLKALRLGLTVDTRWVTCLIEPVAERPFTWTPFTVHCDNARLPQAAPPLVGWWRTYEEFVLTLVVKP
ncbi:MAG: 4'-phosphopantetheinyl transferase superfamily protein [Chloroflexota bacterium]